GAVWREGIRGLGALEEAPDALRALALSAPEAPFSAASEASGWEAGHEAALGTIGGGNHFAEIARVDEIRDRAAAEALGLARGRLVVVAHSGSRGLGTALAQRWGNATLEGAAVDAYLADLTGARRFAQANR